MTAIVGASTLSHSVTVVAQTGGSNPYSQQTFAQPDFEEKVVSAADQLQMSVRKVVVANRTTN